MVDASAASVGVGAGRGRTLNIAWDGVGSEDAAIYAASWRRAPSGMKLRPLSPVRRFGDADYDAAFDRCLMPVARAFAPDLVIISAGEFSTLPSASHLSF